MDPNSDPPTGRSRTSNSTNSAVLDTVHPKQPTPAVIPFPWLWFWLANYILLIPYIFQNLIISYIKSIMVGDGQSAVRPLFTELSVRGVCVVELIPYLVVLLGVIGLLFPKQRAARLERKYMMKDIAPEQLLDIRAFLECHAPNLNIKVNLVQMNEYALVYPTGYRGFAIAIFGPLTKLWRQDTDAAKAVLLHEIAHYRSGDGHIQGTGTLFTTYLKSWFLIFAVSMILPFILNLVSVSVEAISTTLQSHLSILGTLLNLINSFLTIFIPKVIYITLSVFLATLSIIFMPLMGIWIAEVNADFYATQILGDAGAVQRALQYVGKRPSSFIWLLRRMTHPPKLIRRAVLWVRNRSLMLTIILLLMPLAFLARLIIVLVENIVDGIGANNLDLYNIMEELGGGMKNLSGVLIFAFFSLLIWPWLAPKWQSIFTKSRETAIAQKTPYFVASGITLILVLILALVGLALISGILQIIFQ